MSFDFEHVRSDFPILSRKINGQPLAYLDSAASSQKPSIVIEAENYFCQNNYASVHRGIHSMSIAATTDIENVRAQVACFLNASSPEEIVFTKGATESINLVANSWGSSHLREGDNIIITEMEHHANIVPWQMVAEHTGTSIRVLPLTNTYELDCNRLTSLIDNRTRLLAMTHVSNVLGTVNPVKILVSQAKEAGVITLVDGAQAVMHQKVDVQNIGCDFYVFSGHKIYGPTGIGILYGRQELLTTMPPWEGGGAMIETVILPKGTTYTRTPWRLEAGTPNIVGIIGLGAALDYIKSLGIENIQTYENSLMRYTLEQLTLVPDLHIYGPKERTGVISFNLGKYHSYDVGSLLDQYGIAIRTGHHCAMPLMRYCGVSAMCRASFSMYNSREEADRLVAGLTRIHRLLGR